MTKGWTDAHHRVIKDVLVAAFPGARVSVMDVPQEEAVAVAMELNGRRYATTLTRGRQDAPNPGQAAGAFQQYFTQRIKDEHVAG